MKPIRIKDLGVLMAMLGALSMVACGDDDVVIKSDTTTEVTIRLTMPAGAENGTLSDITVTLKELNTGKETVQRPTISGHTISIPATQGYYIITLKGGLTYTNANGYEKHVSVQGYKDGVTLSTEKVTIDIALYMTSEPEPDPTSEPEPADYAYKGFVLSEIFCSGSATPQNTYYYADKYLIIYNNTDHVLYADSLAFAESEFMTPMKEEYHPDIMSQAMAVKALYMIPGSGSDHPVEPGGRIILVDNALNHSYANPNSWDMTHADFEWYDESTNPDYTDIDNPNIPNLERIYSKTLTMYSPHTQGFTAFALLRMKANRIDYLTDYRYDYDYHIVGATGEADMTGSCYKVPNDWIIDAVNIAPLSGMQWLVVDARLDCGFTYVSMFPFDDSRLSKSVRRKVVGRDGNRAILQDTNNSTEDFEPRVDANPFYNY